MRLALAMLLLAAAGATRGGCGGNGPEPYDPCARKACGDPCDPCAPGLPCPMRASPVALQCDGAGRCLAPGQGTTCKACEAKACGAPCAIDPPCFPACLMPSPEGSCDGSGFCRPIDSVRCPPPP
jgi:hypothetical protein